MKVFAAASALVAFVAAGCGLLVGAVGPPPDDFREWSPVPLAPDPALTAEADQTCGPGAPDVLPLPFLFQDRRTQKSAIVMFGDADEHRTCWVSHAGGGGFGSGGMSVGGFVPGDLTIDVHRTGIGGVTVMQVDGEVRVAAARVRVVRVDGSFVEASHGGGRWLAWWPGELAPVRVVALDAAGAEIASTEP